VAKRKGDRPRNYLQEIPGFGEHLLIETRSYFRISIARGPTSLRMKYLMELKRIIWKTRALM
jgi:hypothetical protein